MASIHPYQTKRGKRRYAVRYRDGRQRSRAFSTFRDARAFKLELERKQPIGRLLSDKIQGRRLFDASEIRTWLRSRQEGSTLGGNGAGR